MNKMLKIVLILLKKLLKKELFNELLYGFWFNQDDDKLFSAIMGLKEFLYLQILFF